uniref:Peptidase S1 domain-containing protein n=1 Tax=Gopherus evgoodei TaxID=1825980 RepID=A0A8C4YP47_9SAUR
MAPWLHTDVTDGRSAYYPTSSDTEGNQVTGGSFCLSRSRPYQLVLLRNGRIYCGGSLIAPKWVLTAAHCGTEQIRRIHNFFMHPGYNLHPRDNDFMLLELDDVSGWGRFPATMQCADVYSVSQARCQDSYRGRITDNTLCAGVEQGGIGTCQGNSGGPLVCNGQLQSVVSWGKSVCALPGQPGIYAKVCKAVQWMRSTIGRKCARSA